jgi:nucleotide-binding universal stress UspA family protein
VFTNILVPLDGSELAEQALPVAAGIARRAGARLRIIHALDYLHTDYARCPEPPEWWAENTYDRAARYLSQVAATGLSKWRIPIQTTLIEADPAPVILRSKEARAADLTVMTTHGRSGVERFWLGSVTDAVIREAGHPVLVVPAMPNDAIRDDRPFTHMLVPLDGSEYAERVLHFAAHLTLADGARMSLVRVTRTALVPALNVDLPDAGEEADQYLARQTETLSWMSHEIDYASLCSGDPVATQILDYSNAHQVDVIALSTHGRWGAPRLLLGSVADKVIRGARVPILVAKTRSYAAMGD